MAMSHSKDVKAAVIVSGSLNDDAGKWYGYTSAEMKSKASKFTMPSLWITSEGDTMSPIQQELYDVAPKPCMLVRFKDSALDLSMTYTGKVSIFPAWSKAAPHIRQKKTEHTET